MDEGTKTRSLYLYSSCLLLPSSPSIRPLFPLHLQLADLKAALIRKQAEFKQEKLSHDSSTQPVRKQVSEKVANPLLYCIYTSPQKVWGLNRCVCRSLFLGGSAGPETTCTCTHSLSHTHMHTYTCTCTQTQTHTLRLPPYGRTYLGLGPRRTREALLLPVRKRKNKSEHYHQKKKLHLQNHGIY